MDDYIDVNWSIDPEYIYATLVSDISVADAILDLIDNSIDAARKNINGKQSHTLLQLPTSYDGYEINLTIDESGVIIEDNCHGIEENLLAEKAFRLGARQEQNFSIGMYGVGLVRAYWKLGNLLEVVTDNGEAKFKLQVHKSDILKSENPVVPASKYGSSGEPLSIISINELHPSSIKDLSNTDWQERFAEKVSKVFGLCLQKGLSIRINKMEIESTLPAIRNDVKELRSGQTFHTDEGVKVRISVGAYEGYLFAGESGHSARKNTKLTRNFGWYVACNERVVLIAARTEEVGWNTEWHSEYNGFLGWVYLESDDPRSLPWDSKKTNLVLDHDVQREVAKALQTFSNKYRAINRDFRYDNGSSSSGGMPKSKTTSAKSSTAGTKTTISISKPVSGSTKATSKPTSGTKKNAKKPDHTKDNYFTMLPCEVTSLNPRVADLIHEGQSLR